MNSCEIKPVVLSIISHINRKNFCSPFKGGPEIFIEFVVGLKNFETKIFFSPFINIPKSKSPKEQIFLVKNDFLALPYKGLGAANKWMMVRPSPMGGHHHPLITRFHLTSSPHNPCSVWWTRCKIRLRR